MFQHFIPDCFSSKEANICPKGANAERTAQTIEAFATRRSHRTPKGAVGVRGKAPRFTGHRDAPSMAHKGHRVAASSTALSSGAVQGLREAARSVAMAGGLGACPQGFKVVA